MKKVKVLIEKGSDGTFGAYMPEDNGLEWGIHGDGDTVAEAIADFNASYEDMKAYFAENGKPFTEAEFSFAYDIPSFLLYYGDIQGTRQTDGNIGSPALTVHLRLSQTFTEDYRKDSDSSARPWQGIEPGPAYLICSALKSHQTN